MTRKHTIIAVSLSLFILLTVTLPIRGRRNYKGKRIDNVRGTRNKLNKLNNYEYSNQDWNTRYRNRVHQTSNLKTTDDYHDLQRHLRANGGVQRSRRRRIQRYRRRNRRYRKQRFKRRFRRIRARRRQSYRTEHRTKYRRHRRRRRSYRKRRIQTIRRVQYHRERSHIRRRHIVRYSYKPMHNSRRWRSFGQRGIISTPEPRTTLDLYRRRHWVSFGNRASIASHGKRGIKSGNRYTEITSQPGGRQYSRLWKKQHSHVKLKHKWIWNTSAQSAVELSRQNSTAPASHNIKTMFRQTPQDLKPFGKTGIISRRRNQRRKWKQYHRSRGNGHNFKTLKSSMNAVKSHFNRKWIKYGPYRQTKKRLNSYSSWKVYHHKKRVLGSFGKNRILLPQRKQRRQIPDSKKSSLTGNGKLPISKVWRLRDHSPISDSKIHFIIFGRKDIKSSRRKRRRFLYRKKQLFLSNQKIRGSQGSLNKRGILPRRRYKRRWTIKRRHFRRRRRKFHRRKHRRYIIHREHHAYQDREFTYRTHYIHARSHYVYRTPHTDERYTENRGRPQSRESLNDYNKIENGLKIGNKDGRNFQQFTTRQYVPSRQFTTTRHRPARQFITLRHRQSRQFTSRWHKKSRQFITRRHKMLRQLLTKRHRKSRQFIIRSQGQSRQLLTNSRRFTKRHKHRHSRRFTKRHKHRHSRHFTKRHKHRHSRHFIKQLKRRHSRRFTKRLKRRHFRHFTRRHEHIHFGHFTTRRHTNSRQFIRKRHRHRFSRHSTRRNRQSRNLTRRRYKPSRQFTAKRRRDFRQFKTRRRRHRHSRHFASSRHKHFRQLTTRRHKHFRQLTTSRHRHSRQSTTRWYTQSRQFARKRYTPFRQFRTIQNTNHREFRADYSGFSKYYRKHNKHNSDGSVENSRQSFKDSRKGITHVLDTAPRETGNVFNNFQNIAKVNQKKRNEREKLTTDAKLTQPSIKSLTTGATPVQTLWSTRKKGLRGNKKVKSLKPLRNR